MKVPEGKLVRIDIELEDDHIVRASITGDFFLYPEDAITQLEAPLIGIKKEALEDHIFKMIESIVVNDNLELIGFSSRDLARLVHEALK